MSVEKIIQKNFWTFIWTEKYRLEVTTSGRIQPFCRKHNINSGCFDGTRINPRNITHKNIALKIHNNNFCLNWKSNDISFLQTIKQLQQNFKVVDNIMSDKHVESYIKCEYKPEKVQFPVTNIVWYK